MTARPASLVVAVLVTVGLSWACDDGPENSGFVYASSQVDATAGTCPWGCDPGYTCINGTCHADWLADLESDVVDVDPQIAYLDTEPSWHDAVEASISPVDAYPDDQEGPDTGEIQECFEFFGLQGCPCESDYDCAIGLCLPTPDGHVCTDYCTDSCSQGWSCEFIVYQEEGWYVCIPPLSVTCLPCTQDADCQGAEKLDDGWSWCVSYGPSGSFCADPCEADDDCGAGFLCQGLETGGGHCIADSGVCTCSELVAQTDTSSPCLVENEHGACVGLVTCPAVGEPFGCDAAIPSEEICNGLDDDCDGETDEGFPDSDGDGIGDPCDPD